MEAGRLSRSFQDPFGCAAYMRSLSPEVRDGVYDGVALDAGSGFPILKDVLALQADREIAAGFVAAQDDRLRAGKASTPRVAAKTAYYRRLLAVDLPPVNGLQLRLRRLLPGGASAQYEVVLDRYDAVESVFSRYTLLLEQSGDSGLGALVQRDGDYSRQTAAFRDKMERVLQDDSELAFLIIGKVPGVRVEEITRARIGPLWSPWCPGPPGWFPDSDDMYVLHLPVDRASVGLDADRDDDPFSTIYREFLSGVTRPLVEDEARRLGYRVHKDRKFVCFPPAAADQLRGRLAKAGTKNLVYSI